MSLEAISLKRIRRQWEPEGKTWHDGALDAPWEDLEPALHKATIFAMKNVFFFSHATPVQARTIGQLAQDGHSAIVEAPTGSGKTLAFLIPMMERTVRACEAYTAAHKRPPLTRNILGIILSPSRTLAEQTFVVAKSLAARFPFNIQFALCDGVVEKAEHVVHRLRHNTRGAGTFLVTTPKDLVDVLALLEGSSAETAQGSRAGWQAAFKEAGSDRREESVEELLAQQDARTQERYWAKRQRQEKEEAHGASSAQSSTSSGRGGCGATMSRKTGTAAEPDAPSRATENTVRLGTCGATRFILVIDEADLVFNSPEMREIVTHFISTHCQHTDDKHGSTASKRPGADSLQVSERKKRNRVAVGGARADTTDTLSDGRVATDYAFVGATVATSDLVHRYANEECAAARSELHLVASRSSDDFLSQLQNRYVVCDAYNFLPFLIQMMNLHASKKHFVFFNSFRALQFVQKLFSILSQGPRPMLFVKDVYTMYEGMTENARIEQYNQFLTHASATKLANAAMAKASKEKRNLSDAQKRNQVFTSGWKRDGSAPMGSGAILLCTDIAAFGLDVRDVDYVYHFEPPATVQSYVHRVGRVGRMGMKGSSILLLPCVSESGREMEQSRERKTTSTRFNTVKNTKNSTMELQSVRVSADALTEERRQYVADLGTHSSLEEYNLPPFAPIASTLRNIIAQDGKLLKLAKAAAIAMCQPPGEGETTTWFTPKLALRSLLLD